MIILYWISRGFTEGWKWSDKIPSTGHYHLMRLLEVLCIFFIAKYGIEWKTIVVDTLIGIFIYERINMYVDKKVWFKKPGSVFDIGIKIKRYPWQDWLILITGILIWLYA